MFCEIIFIEILFWFILYLGPLTYTDEYGQTTVYGIVSGAGNKHKQPMTTAAFTRVSYPDIYYWIWETMEEYEKYR